MKDSHPGSVGVIALAAVFALLAVSPVAAQGVTLTFSGEITYVVQSPLPPFEDVSVGDLWTLSYTFDPGDDDDDPSETAGKYSDVIAAMTLTIGDATVAGTPEVSIPNGQDGVIAVNLESGSADYTAMVGLPAPGDAWAQVILWDEVGTPFLTDALPLELPEPYDTVFPDHRTFYLRQPGSTLVFLEGEIDPTISTENGTHTKVRADFALRVDDPGDRHLDLLWGVAGVEGFSYGVLHCPGCEVMGVEPSPFVWHAVDANGAQPSAGEAVLSINLDNPGGEVMGVEPSPFRFLVTCGVGCSGELDFSEATATYPGPLGGLSLEGVRLVLEEGTRVDLESFDIYDATDKVALLGPRIDRFIDAPDVVGLVSRTDDTDVGVAGVGFLSCPGCEVMGVEPSPFKWLAFDTGQLPPPEGTEVVTFDLDPVGEVSGVEPSPFKVWLSFDGERLAELDFGSVEGGFPGVLGSLSLRNLDLVLPDGSSLPVESLDIYDQDDSLTLVDSRVDLRVIERIEANERQVDLVVNSSRYGVAGFGSGAITNPGGEVMGVEPSPFRWIVDPQTGIPADEETAVTYLSDLASARMGFDPTPFRHLIVDSGGVVLGGVDFRASEGVWGSFHLEGVEIGLVDGSTLEMQAFETFDVVDVEIDVKPGCEDNTVNLGSSGVIPVAVLSSSIFDATLVNPETVSLAGASVKLVGNGKRYLANQEDVNDDGLDDLMCKILTEEIEIEVGDSVVVLEAETYDGTAVVGQDFIRIVPD